MPICCECGVKLEIGKNWRIYHKDAHTYKCISCYNTYYKEYARKNKISYQKSKKKYYEKNKLKILKQQREYRRNKRKMMPGEGKRISRRYIFSIDYLDNYGFIAKIPLNHDKYAIIDIDDLDLVITKNWTCYSNRNKYYVHRNSLKKDNHESRRIEMHREIMSPDKDQIVDHINGNGLDNRRCNLRIVTSRQNSQNRHHIKTSKYPGVSKHNNYKNPWQARIYYNGKLRHIGLFPTEKEAYNAYEKAVKELTGEEIIML